MQAGSVDKIETPLTAQQKVAMSRNIEKMIGKALGDPDQVRIHASTDHLKWQQMVREMWESTLCQPLHVPLAIDTHKSVFWFAQMMLCIMTLRYF